MGLGSSPRSEAPDKKSVASSMVERLTADFMGKVLQFGVNNLLQHELVTVRYHTNWYLHVGTACTLCAKRGVDQDATS